MTGAECRRTRIIASLQLGMFIALMIALLAFRFECERAVVMSTGASDRSEPHEKLRGTQSETRHRQHVNVTAASSPQADSSFQPENLLLSNRVPCGANKCFFPLKSNPQIGYLVAPSKRKSDKERKSSTAWFRTLEASWQLAEYLENEYDIRQFLLEPPRSITVTNHLASHLNRNLWRESQSKMLTKDRYPEGSTAFIQKVQTAPTLNLLIGCAPSKVRQFQQDVDEFLPSIERRNSFASNFKNEMRKARKLMKDEPCLIKDFQVLVDTKGELYHLDFDRCFMPGEAGTKRIISKELSDSCFEALDEIENRVQKALFASK